MHVLSPGPGEIHVDGGKVEGQGPGVRGRLGRTGFATHAVQGYPRGIVGIGDFEVETVAAVYDGGICPEIVLKFTHNTRAN